MSALTHTARADGLPPAAVSPYRRTTPTLLRFIGAAIWRTLVRIGQRRAARELELLAQRREPFDPELARELRAAARIDPNA